ncbi:MAG: serine/threonine-protein phosphatase [Bacteroidales bacterium]|nr:serine/threonine-protein phosphatase [Candidatus Physcousia equi]
MKISFHAHTDIGLSRDVNEDAFAFCPNLERALWHSSFDLPDANVETYLPFAPLSQLGAMLVVADGMGGTMAGEVASRMAIETVRRLCTPEALLPLLSAPQGAVHSFLCHVVEEAHADIRRHAATHSETIGMASTIVVAWLARDAHICWCGDSRAYIFQPRIGLRRITLDHSFVQQLCTQGEITEEEMLTHPDNNLLTRCVGDTDLPAAPECTTLALQPNSLLLLCTDGLSGYSYADDIERYVRRGFTSGRPNLVSLAHEVEAQDNITTLCAAIIPDHQQRPTLPLSLRLKDLFHLGS